MGECRGAGWSEVALKSEVTIIPYELKSHFRDIGDGYYCPTLPDLLDACGGNFAHLYIYIVANIWTAESDEPKTSAIGDFPEEAVPQL